jgi:hypothetical protein
MASHCLRCLLGVALCLLLSGVSPTDVGDVERWALIDGRSVGEWTAVESTLSLGTAEGEDAFLFHVPVDWTAGEKDYPVGWPRIHMRVPDDKADWRRWEQLRLRVYAPAEGDPLPADPIGVSLGTGDHHSSWGRNATGLRRGDWMEFALDLSDVPDADRVHSIVVFVSESNYRHGDTLRFYVSRLELVRHLKPTLAGLESVPGVAFADAAAVSFRVKMLGVGSGTARIEIALRRGEVTVSQTTARVVRGTTLVTLPLSPTVPPGEYTVVARAGETEISQPIRLVASPWQEVAQ